MVEAEGASGRERENKRSTTRSSAWVFRITLSYLALPLTSLASGPLLARFLGPAERGELAAILTPIALLTVVLSFGMQDATNNFVARNVLSPQRAVQMLSLPALALGALAAGLIWSLAPLIFPDQPTLTTLLRVGSLTLIPEFWLNILRGAVLGKAQFGLANAERWLGAASRLGVLLFLAFASALTLGTAAWTTLGSSLLGGAALLLVLRGNKVHPPPPKVSLGPVAYYGLRSWSAGLAGLMNARLDQAVLLPFVGANALGQYAVATTLATLSQYFSSAVRDVLLTRATSEDGIEATARAARVLALTGCVAGSIGVVAAPIIIPALFGGQFRDAVPLAQLLFIGSLPTSVSSALSAGLMARGKPGRVSLAEIAGLLVTCAGLLALTRPIGVTGAALTSVAAYSATCTVLVLAMRRHERLSVRDCLVPRAQDLAWIRSHFRR